MGIAIAVVGGSLFFMSLLMFLFTVGQKPALSDPPRSRPKCIPFREAQERTLLNAKEW